MWSVRAFISCKESSLLDWALLFVTVCAALCCLPPGHKSCQVSCCSGPGTLGCRHHWNCSMYSARFKGNMLDGCSQNCRACSGCSTTQNPIAGAWLELQNMQSSLSGERSPVSCKACRAWFWANHCRLAWLKLAADTQLLESLASTLQAKHSRQSRW